MCTRILVTGANGFVGGRLFWTLMQKVGFEPIGVCRSVPPGGSSGGLQALGNLESADFSLVLHAVDVVVHTAARAHIMRDEALDPLAEYRRVNVAGTLRLAQQAAAAGVKRFIFISSIKVNGESTQPGRPYRADDAPNPEDAYGISKAEAEAGLRTIAQETGMELVVIRPVLVYGPEVKGNFQSVVRAVARGIPLPLGGVTGNRRSLVALDNLVDLICACVNHPRAAGQIFLVSDGEDLSTADLLRRIAMAGGAPARLLPVPPVLLRWGARLLGKEAVAQRLLGSLQVDITKTRELLGWQPPLTVNEGLKKLAENQS